MNQAIDMTTTTTSSSPSDEQTVVVMDKSNGVAASLMDG
jgi:hypothetical protein